LGVCHMDSNVYIFSINPKGPGFVCAFFFCVRRKMQCERYLKHAWLVLRTPKNAM